MRPLAVLALLAFAAAGCSDSPCQELGERICGCQPGATSDGCTTQVETQLEAIDVSDDACDARLAECFAPGGVDFCEWLLTEAGKVACGLEPPAAP